jgi:uncharacterized protein YdeI (YjbR/CyaY-like superfamily)
MDAIYFGSAAEFHQWLKENGYTTTEILLGFYKKDSGLDGITYKEALDEALCFGWIDAVRRRVEETRFTIWFTPRKARSIWSNVNTKRAEELIKLGRMQSGGLKVFEKRDPARAGVYAFENAEWKLDAASEKKFKANKKAWEFFQTQAPWYQRTASWWVISAKREETRVKRLEQLIKDSDKGQRLRHLSRKLPE